MQGSKGWIRRECTLCTSGKNTTRGPKWGMRGDITNWGGGWCSVTAAILESQGNMWPVGHWGLLPAWIGKHTLIEEIHWWLPGKRHSFLISTIALSGKVSADRAVGFILHNLGCILGWAGVLKRDQLFSLQGFFCPFSKSSPEGPPWTVPENDHLPPWPTTT